MRATKVAVVPQMPAGAPWHRHTLINRGKDAGVQPMHCGVGGRRTDQLSRGTFGATLSGGRGRHEGIGRKSHARHPGRHGQQAKHHVAEPVDAMSKGVISLLQEFVQSSRLFRGPQHRAILQWNFDNRMADFTTLEFSATVAFLLDGVPHHVSGYWHLSKKNAQRDAAERSLAFFVGCWGEQMLGAALKTPPPGGAARSPAVAAAAAAAATSAEGAGTKTLVERVGAPAIATAAAAAVAAEVAAGPSRRVSQEAREVQLLHDFILNLPACAKEDATAEGQHDAARSNGSCGGGVGAAAGECDGGDSSTTAGTDGTMGGQPDDRGCAGGADFHGGHSTAPRWDVSWDGQGKCTAMVEISLLGVPHRLAGPARPSEHAAKADTARRVLWYLQAPGYESLFEPDPLSPAIMASEIPTPPRRWMSDADEEDAQQVAERKTVLMRVQNRLQQALAKRLRLGQGVWEWTYETDPCDPGWPPLCRATAHIPVIGRDFTGEWARGQRAAQVSASEKVAAFLDMRTKAGGELLLGCY